MTHMNQVVIGGVLRCVEGLRLLGPAGGPRESLVSWKRNKTSKKLVYLFQEKTVTGCDVLLPYVTC